VTRVSLLSCSSWLSRMMVLEVGSLVWVEMGANGSRGTYFGVLGGLHTLKTAQHLGVRDMSVSGRANSASGCKGRRQAKGLKAET
jgi:hypothetical protein